MSVIFITGTDTDIGKTFVTGLLAKYLLKQNKSVITQKIAQTGCIHTSEDIEKHREIMGIPFCDDDKSGLTCPYIFKFPASPHLAAKMENRIIDPEVIKKATDQLEEKYDFVITEGVGGLYVPLNEDSSLLDYLEKQKYPTLLVSSSKLGSINHTLLSIEIAKHRNIEIIGIVYNHFPKEKEEIVFESKQIFKKYLKKFGYPEIIIDIPEIKSDKKVNIDFSELF